MDLILTDAAVTMADRMAGIFSGDDGDFVRITASIGEPWPADPPLSPCRCRNLVTSITDSASAPQQDLW